MFCRDGRSCHCSGGTAQQDTCVVVVGIGEPPACPFDVLDRRVVGFDFRCCCSGDDEDFDFFPPTADGAAEPVRLGLRGLFDQGLQPGFRGCCVGEGTGAQQASAVLL